jgi:hypothetical protein
LAWYKEALLNDNIKDGLVVTAKLKIAAISGKQHLLIEWF